MSEADDIAREALGEQAYIHELKGRIELGMDAQAFLKTDLGRYLITCSDRDVLEGLRQLRTVDPNDTKAVGAAQQKCEIAERWLQWLTAAIETGRNAEVNFVNAEAQG